MVPKGKAGKKPGGKSDPHEILKRVVTVGKLMHIRGMTLSEIYQWNLDPGRGIDPDTGAPVPNMWGFSYRQIHELSKKAQKLGGSLLVKNYDEAIRRAVRMWYDLKEKAENGSDFRCAALCIVQISKIQDTYLGKQGKPLMNPVSQAPHQWAATQPELLECKDVTAADYDRIIGPPPKP